MVFPVVRYGCKTWTIKKAGHQRTDAFELCWTARNSNQSILKKINPEYSLEVLMLKLKLQYFGNLMRRTDSLEKPWCWQWQEEKGAIEDEILGWHYWLNGHGFEKTLGDCEGQGSLSHCSPWGYKESDMTESSKFPLEQFRWLHFFKTYLFLIEG